MSEKHIEIGLHAAVVAVDKKNPLVLTVSKSGSSSELAALPFGPFDPIAHRTLEEGLRIWVAQQTKLPLGYVEQLYTFGDRGRLRAAGQINNHFISVGYLALLPRPAGSELSTNNLTWNSWYQHFPWEDWRDSRPIQLERIILPALLKWLQSKTEKKRPACEARIRLAFGCERDNDGNFIINIWDEERVLERYELMYEAGLVAEFFLDGRSQTSLTIPSPGQAMLHDHRRILATAMARLRAKLKYRPVVFELMPQIFTLTELQTTVETLSGQRLHKQNFRRMVDNAQLVEPTGATSSETGGRPAAYFRFLRSITRERPAPGLRVGNVY